MDVRGRGNSEGEFHPLLQEARDGYDVVEWLAGQPYCNGKVTMWGGSYAGYDQWATAKEFPPHLATIVPVASPYAGVDFPMFNNVFFPYDMQWLTFTSGRASQDHLFGDGDFWTARNRQMFESGRPFKEFDALVGNPSPIFQEWVAHPQPDAYWDSYNPTAEEYAKLAIPILSITGSHDGDQPGALAHYREYMKNATAEGKARHYLIIGPWDHAGTRTPQAEFGGLTFGPASLVDLPKLHLDWYAWTMQGGREAGIPAEVRGVLRDVRGQVALCGYARGSHRRIARLPSGLDGECHGSLCLGLDRARRRGKGRPDHYVYDPRDVSGAAARSRPWIPQSLTDQRLMHARSGKQLIYHSAPFEKDTEISGFFRLAAWIAIDTPDTDFGVNVYEIRAGRHEHSAGVRCDARPLP